MTSGEYFEKQFNTVWDNVKERIDDTPELRQIFYDAFMSSGCLVNERLVFVPIYGVKLSNYANYANYRYEQLVKTNDTLTKKEVKPTISAEWKNLSVEERSKWSNSTGTGEVQEKAVTKKSCSGYNLFTRDLAKTRRRDGGETSLALSRKKASVSWNLLSQEVRDDWNRRARELDTIKLKRDRRKESKRVSGYNLYIRQRSDELKAKNQSCNLIQIAGEWTLLSKDQKDHWNTVAKEQGELREAAAAAAASEAVATPSA
jgi:hypothetical protein